MTDRLTYLVVAVEGNPRVDDIDPLVSAICQMKGVVYVEKGVSDYQTWAAEARVRKELIDKLWAVLNVVDPV
jgi:hypothetical protein